MIPRTYPTEYITAGGQTRIVVYALTSVVGLTAWVDYIPVKGIPEADESTALENTYAVDGYMIMRSSESTTGLTAWVDYLPVYEDVSATIPWSTDAGGYIPASGLFGIASLFAAGEEGVWFDPSDMDTLYQDSAGTTPVTAVEQPVGLMLDKSKGPAGSELSTGLATGSLSLAAFTADTGGSVSVGIKTILFTVTVSSFTSGSLTIGVGVQSVSANRALTISAAGTYSTLYTIPASETLVQYRALGSGFVGTVDNISVKEVPGNHATQATSAKRPTLSARYNLLTYSEQFDNAAWTKQQGTVTSNAAIAPDGTTTADKFTPNTASAAHTPYQAVTVSDGTASVYAKAAGENYIGIKLVGGTITASNTVVFNLSAGTISNATGNTASIEDVGSGWYRCSVTAASITSFLLITTADGVTFYYTGNDTDGIYVWGAQLTVADSLPNNEYQRIAAATDYDTVGFKPYLKFDGVDDAMATNSIDFSAGDKMTVWAGLRRLSDGSLQAYFELSAVVSSNSGSFIMYNNTSGTQSFYNKGTSSAEAISAIVLAPTTQVLTGIGAISTPVVTLRMNGTQVATSAATQGTGNYGAAYPLYIGARAGTSLYYNGYLYSLIVRAAESTATDITNAETWVNGKTGAY